MTRYLLDNDIAIELLPGRNIRVAGSLASKNREQIFLSTVTVAELCLARFAAGILKRAWRQFCSSFQIAGLDYAAAERSSVIRADLEGRGERIGAYDMLIAGIALAHGCVLATHKVRDFGRVVGLPIEDWTELA